MQKILVIEDDPIIRSNIVDLLQVEGFETLEAENGLIGVHVAQAHLPNLIMSDIMMPELDGYGVLETLRHDPVTAAIPFVFLTAKAERTDLRQGMEAGADDYLTKPFTRGELLKAIETRLAKQSSVEKKFQKQLEDLRDSITLSLPHELRTPLTGVLGFSSVLVDSYGSLTGLEILDVAKTIHKSAERLYRLVENYLLYAEIQIIGLDPEKLAVLRTLSGMSDLQAIVAPAATRIAQQAGRKADLKLELQDAQVAVIPAHLKKIIEELVDNAFKFSEAGTAVRVTSRSAEGSTTLRVADQGRGMLPQQILAIGALMQFERKIHEQQGSGLGLTLAKCLIELNGGGLVIDSLPDQGTTVHVTLPARSM
jgi:signal transduction histidine kinase